LANAGKNMDDSLQAFQDSHGPYFNFKKHDLGDGMVGMSVDRENLSPEGRGAVRNSINTALISEDPIKSLGELMKDEKLNTALNTQEGQVAYQNALKAAWDARESKLSADRITERQLETTNIRAKAFANRKKVEKGATQTILTEAEFQELRDRNILAVKEATPVRTPDGIGFVVTFDAASESEANALLELQDANRQGAAGGGGTAGHTSAIDRFTKGAAGDPDAVADGDDGFFDTFDAGQSVWDFVPVTGGFAGRKLREAIFDNGESPRVSENAVPASGILGER